MKVAILKDCTEESINRKLTQLQGKNKVIDVVYYPETHGHYQTYCLIKYKELANG